MPKRMHRDGPVRSIHRAPVADVADICATCSRPLEVREARVQDAREARVNEARVNEARVSEARVSEAREAREARVSEARVSRDDEEDDVPILELVRRCDAEWRAPGRGKVYEIHKIVDWKIDRGSRGSHDLRSIFFLVWWKGYELSESTWEPAAGIHPIEQVRFFKSVGVFD